MYAAVNEALNGVIFSGRFESRPVFMALDSQSRADVAKFLDQDEGLVESYICTQVGDALSRVGNPYSPMEATLTSWRRNGMQGKPPFTALLYCLSHAAELMASDGQYTGGNYYVRLSELTGLPRSQISVYGHETEKFWHWLAKWLSASDYRFGRPTARAINQFKYVSIPMSQAIVRAGDRECFHDLFERYGFSGGYDVTEAEIERYVDSWIRSSASNQRLRQAWARREMRSRVCEIVLAELDEWSSGKRAAGKSAAQRVSNLSLALALVPAFPSRVAALSLGLHGEIESSIELRDDGGHELTLGNDVYGSFATLSPSNRVPLPDLLLRGATYDSIDGHEGFQWRYRAVLPFVRAESGPFWIETNKTAIDSQNIILARDRSSIRNAVEALLVEIAAPGYTLARPSELPGLPAGWVLYENVRIVRLPTQLPDNNDLRSLVPVARTAGLKPVGGLRLSRNVWHRKHPPSFHLEVAQGPSRISLFEGIDENGGEITSVEDPGLFCTLDLNGLIPPSGDMVGLGFGHNKEVGYLSLLFRTSRRPRPLDADAICGLQYVSAISALPRSGIDLGHRHPNHEHGASLPPARVALEEFEELHGEGEEEKGSVAISDASLAPSRRQLSIDEANMSELSCGERGGHYWLCETVPQGGKPDMPLQMECRDCKLSVLTENRGKKPIVPKKVESQPLPPPPRQAEKIDAIDSDLLLDALCFLGEGSWGTFESLVSTSVSEPWEAVNLAKALEALGYLDLCRLAGSGKISRWAVPAPSIYLAADGQALLRGFRNPPLVEMVVDRLVAKGAQETSVPCAGQPRSISIQAVLPEMVVELASELRDPHGRLLDIVFDAPRAFARRLAAIRPATDMVVPISIANDMVTERFDLGTGKWQKSVDFDSVGAYRFPWRGQTYAYRGPSGSLVQGSHEVVKLLAARDAGATLHAYLPSERLFVARTGTEPIGLAARALCSCSGTLPERLGNTLRYANVPIDVAGAILSSLYLPRVHDENC